MARRFIDIVKQPIETSAGLVSVGASLGFALYPQHATSIGALKKKADIAMYTAKRNHGGWLLYEPYMMEDSNSGEASRNGYEVKP